MVLDLLISALLILSIGPVLAGRRLVAGTTLSMAWIWTVFSWGSWNAAWFASWIWPRSLGLQDQFWYAAAVVSLCPPIAVLGARRPGVRVWTGFILLPLLAVFLWPAVTDWMSSGPLPRLQLQFPVLLSFLLVLTMGLGNYLPTRFALSVLVLGLGLLMVVLGVSESAPRWAWYQAHHRQIGLLLVISGAMLAGWESSRPSPRRVWYDAIWDAFRDTFGLVWSRRIMDRVNARAAQEGWACRLDGDRFDWRVESSRLSREETETRIDQTFQWLLKRFVDPDWIQRRIDSSEPGVWSRPSESQANATLETASRSPSAAGDRQSTEPSVHDDPSSGSETP